MSCRICGGKLLPIHSYPNMPVGAQNFLNSPEDEDSSIMLQLMQCGRCGIVLLDNPPVPYYRVAHRTGAWMNQPWRRKQLTEFIRKYDLKGKHMRNIMWEPYLDKYNAFFLLNYLEHLPDPRFALRTIVDSLESPGVGIVEVPNFDMIIKDRVFSEFTLDHLYYYTKDTLTTVLNLSGFSVVATNTYSHDFILSVEVKKRQPLDMAPFIRQEGKSIELLDQFLQKFDSVAVWGAGHQALMILSMLPHKRGIKYIVDSSPKKQGKYTPYTRMPIFRPEQLLNQPVEAILVLVGGFYESVLEQIKKLKLNPKPSVGVVLHSDLELVDI